MPIVNVRLAMFRTSVHSMAHLKFISGFTVGKAIAHESINCPWYGMLALDFTLDAQQLSCTGKFFIDMSVASESHHLASVRQNSGFEQ